MKANYFRDYARKWRAQNRERYNAQAREYNRRWRIMNRERYNAWAREYQRDRRTNGRKWAYQGLGQVAIEILNSLGT